MKAGILTLALGHPYYGRLAVNLAASTKAGGTSVPLALVYTPSAIADLNEKQLALFDVLIEAPPEAYHNETGAVEYAKAKMNLYALSPFDQTLFLDADTVWLPNRKIEDLLAELSGVPYAAQNYTYANLETLTTKATGYTYWMDLKAIREKWNLSAGRLPQQSTTFLWWRKEAATERLFARACELYDDDRNPKAHFLDGKPDELYFNLACALEQVYPHRCPFVPVHFHHLHPQFFLKEMRGFWALTNGGDRCPATIIQLYNQLTAAAGLKLGVECFRHRDKADLRGKLEMKLSENYSITS